MSKTFAKKDGSAENKVLQEVVTRPLAWRVSEPHVSDCGDIGVDVYYFVHNGTKDLRGDHGQMEMFFEREEFSPILKAVDELDSFTRIKELGKLAALRDKEFSELNLILCDAFDKSPSTDRLAIYEEIEEMLFRDEECHGRLRKLVKVEALLSLLKRPKVFYSEELQTLFA